MGKVLIVNTLIIVSVFILSPLYSQTFSLGYYFDLGIGNKNWIVYNYEYVEFNDSAHLDSSIVLESFHGELTVTIDDIRENSDTIQYKLLLSKAGEKVIRTYYDTITVENIKTEYWDSVFVIPGIQELGGFHHIYGWIFPDTMVQSVIDPFDSIPMYPYSRLYQFYDVSLDDSLFHVNDTLFIHYRPIFTNYYDSYYSIDYILNVERYVRSYSRNYSYYGEGFYEKYEYKYGYYANIEKPDFYFTPTKLFLYQNYPNPFNSTTTIRFSLYKRVHIKLEVYDLLGNKIGTLIDEIKNIGNYELEFDAHELSSGIYYYRLSSGEGGMTKKFVVLK